MKAQINLITIWTNSIHPMKNFYKKILGFNIINDLGDYVEFQNSGVRFALCMRSVMFDHSDAYKIEPCGQTFELAFPCDTIEDVDYTYKIIIDLGATPVQEPKDMPWGQRTALFADPDSNIHEIFCQL